MALTEKIGKPDHARAVAYDAAAPGSIIALRAAGVFDPVSSGATAIVDRLKRMSIVRGASLAVMDSPGMAPMAGVVYARNQRPEVTCHVRPDGSFLLIDGEIYGWGNGAHGDPDLRNNAAAYELLDRMIREGPRALAGIDAAAVFILWDAGRRRLTLCRDRSGIVPVFWTRRGSTFIWASHMETLHALGVEKRPCLQAIDYFLASACLPSPWTTVEGVYKVPPAHAVCWDGTAEPHCEAYWKPTGKPKLVLSADERSGRLLELLETSLRRRTGADNRLGMLLSGGIDSTLLAAVARARLGISVDAFTFHYSHYDGTLNESIPARRVARHFGARHHEICFAPDQLIRNWETMIRQYGEPLCYGAHSFGLAALVEAGVPAVIVGTGPDGWSLYRGEELALRYRRVPQALRTLIRPALGLMTSIAPDRAHGLRTIDFCARTGLAASLSTPVADDGLRRALWRGNYEGAGRHDLPGHLSMLGESLQGESDHDRMTYSGLHVYSAEAVLFWNHQWSRAYGVPIRHPYFDNDYYDFFMRLPRNQTGKVELREAAASFMPNDIAYARKIYQALPLTVWMRGPLKSFVHDQLDSERIRRQGLFNPAAVDRIVTEHMDGRADRQWLIVALISLASWLDQRNPPLKSLTLVVLMGG